MRVLIELPTWLGDTVMVTPAIENLVHHFNDVEIILIGSYVSIEALKNHP
jgi:heptosyltransferase II